MTFEEIEEFFPGGGVLVDDESGKFLVSAQWLHDFARNVSNAENFACSKICEDFANDMKFSKLSNAAGLDCAFGIRKRLQKDAK